MFFRVVFHFFTSLFITSIMSHDVITNTTLKHTAITTTRDTPTDSNIGLKMKEVGIIPNVVRESPKHYMKVVFKKSIFSNFEVQPTDKGVHFDHSTMKNKPSRIHYECHDLDFYTLFFTNLEPKRLTHHNQFHHWIVYNIPGENWKDGIEFLPYKSSAPTSNEENRVYVFLLFKQKRELSLDLGHLKNHTITNAARTAFTINDFIKKCDLDGLHAANFLRQAITR